MRRMNQKTGIPARPGSLHPEALQDLILLRQFFHARDQALTVLLDASAHRSPLRDELLRRVMIEFGEGRSRRMSFYQDECVFIAGRFATRDEILRLNEFGVLCLINDATHKRAVLVEPSQSLVDWYSNQMPRLRQVLRNLLLQQSDN